MVSRLTIILYCLAFITAAITGCSANPSPEEAKQQASKREELDKAILQAINEQNRNMKILVENEKLIIEGLRIIYESNQMILTYLSKVNDKLALDLHEAAGKKPSEVSEGTVIAAEVVEKTPRMSKTLHQLSPQDLFKGALSLYEKKDFNQAILKLEEFIARYPQNDLVQRAYFVKAESYYYLNDFRTALDEFTKFVFRYPNSEMLAKASLYIALCFKGLDNITAATNALEKIIADYPRTIEAQRAKEELEALSR